jgi:signal peptidase I
MFFFNVRGCLTRLIFLPVLLLGLLAVTRVFGSYRAIPSESMVPTLMPEDRIWFDSLTPHWQPFKRGDLILFYPPDAIVRYDPVSVLKRHLGLTPYFHKKEELVDVAYVKRLIAMPGDVVDVQPGVGVQVNGKLLTEPYINEVALSCTFVSPIESCGPARVPAGKVYVLGDNRNASQDSRYFGFVDWPRIESRATYRIFPANRAGGLDTP